MNVKDLISTKLTAALDPTTLVVTDESDLHAGHAGSREGGETHFRIHIVAAAFAGKSRIERHRMVNGLLGEAFGRGLHALAIHASAPGEPDAPARRP